MARAYLKLVRDRSAHGETASAHFEELQSELLPTSDRTLAICAADGLDQALLMSLVSRLRPAAVVDLRTAPRFDFGTFNRRQALALFESVGARYQDQGPSVRLISDETLQNALASSIATALNAVGGAKNANALVALVDAGVDFERTGLLTIQQLREQSGSPWELLLFGAVEKDEQPRDLIFISHANPEDNEFSLWLQTQLTRLGYATWSDLTMLKAGEVFWDAIEDVIRNQAARVIAVVSKSAMQKPGVLDEISLAVSIERTRQIPGFVIPIRVDEIPFSEFRANIARKNVLDFSKGWALGLSRLAETLSRDKVYRAKQGEGQSLASWWAQQKPPTLSVTAVPEILLSNRFRVKLLPKRVFSYSGTPAAHDLSVVGAVPYRNMWLSFQSEEELRATGLSGLAKESVLSAADLFAGNLSLTSNIAAVDRQRLLHRMLNKQWEAFLFARGLRLYRQTGSRPTPYIPDGLLPNNTAFFRDEQGTQRRRLLVGSSVKRNLYWHLAPLGSFVSSPSTSLSIKMRVLFSEDGQDKWPTAERIRTMRRSFCKSWWNDRWRSLQSALMAWLASGRDGIAVYTGDGGTLEIESGPMQYRGTLSIDESHVRADENNAGGRHDDEPSIDEAEEWSEDDGIPEWGDLAQPDSAT